MFFRLFFLIFIFASTLYSFSYFKKIDSDIKIDIDKKIIYAGDIRYKFPLLLKLDKNLQAIPYIESINSKPLYKYIHDFEDNDSFIWIDSCDRINAVSSKPIYEKYCYALGALGENITTSGIKKKHTNIPLSFLSNNFALQNSELSDFRKKRLKKLEKNYVEVIKNKIDNELYIAYPRLKNYIKTQFWLALEKIEQNSNSKETKNLCIDDPHKKNRLIAHAGGAIEGHIYTNSLEALELSYKNGFRLFELDISKTKDQVYVAVHDWESWAKRTGFKKSIPPTLKEFKQYKIDSKFTPLDINDVNNWFDEHKDSILITDKINTPLDFSQHFIDKKRLIMELFTWEAVAEGINAEMLSAMPTWKILSHINGDIADSLEKLKITHIAASKKIIAENKRLLKNLKNKNIKVYIYDVNEISFMCNSLDIAYGIYADYWDFSKPLNCAQ
ncbi:MAG: phosphoglycerol transferase [Campylobacterota bacterium]|nr:phosphoglycerol transferase [Campylobacterota bacterium]